MDIKEIGGGKVKRGDIMIYNNVPCFDDMSYLGKKNRKDYIRIVYQKFILKVYSKLDSKNCRLEIKLFNQIDSINQLCFELLTELTNSLDEAIDDLNHNSLYKSNLDNVYIDNLSQIESALDNIQLHLIKSKSILDKRYFKYHKRKKIDSLLQKTNRNLNMIIEIRDKISLLDDMTNNMRFYTELNKKYHTYCNFLLVVIIINAVLAIINIPYYPRLISVGVGLMSLIGFTGFKCSKHRTNMLYFKNRIIHKDCGNL